MNEVCLENDIRGVKQLQRIRTVHKLAGRKTPRVQLIYLNRKVVRRESTILYISPSRAHVHYTARGIVAYLRDLAIHLSTGRKVPHHLDIF